MSTAPIAMTTGIEPKKLLDALEPWVKRLVGDLREQSETDAEMGAGLRAEYDAEFAAGRTGEAYGAWLEGALTQAAVAWLLATVFVRFLEDNRFIDPRLSGLGERREQALERETAYYSDHRTGSVTDYLLATFEGLRRFQATALLFDPDQVPLWRLRLSGDAARDLLAFWRMHDPDTGTLIFDFTSVDLDTRFLGDLYQDLSVYARKKYALLQTPVFVEEFILDRTLEPAIEAFGLEEIRMIDPTCGSGHFLLGGFERVLAKWRRLEPGTNPAVLVRRALDAVYGVDLNPYAVAVARFRLLVAALREAGIRRLADELDVRVNVAVGDTLLCAPTNQGQLFVHEEQRRFSGLPGLTKYEDGALLERIFSQQYHAVVGNPPYVTVKDPSLNRAYRDRYPESCFKVYSLGAPFSECFFGLALSERANEPAGFVGLINADSFMKCVFGKRLIESVLPKLDLTHVISTAGAFIPGHKTPTVIMFGRNRRPVSATVRVLMGLKREPKSTTVPENGLVWNAIITQADVPGTKSLYIQAADVSRESLQTHPWILGGDLVAQIREAIENAAPDRLNSVISGTVGGGARVGADQTHVGPKELFLRQEFEKESIRNLVTGDQVRDWMVQSNDYIFYPYVYGARELSDNLNGALKFLWTWRTTLENRATFQGVMSDAGLTWFEYMQHSSSPYSSALAITQAFIATHNHFVLERGGRVFNRHAPTIKLKNESLEEYLGVLGVLNSSAICFWLKQYCRNKGGGSWDEPWLETHEFNGASVERIPLPAERPIYFAKQLVDAAERICDLLPHSQIQASIPSREHLDCALNEVGRIRQTMVFLQEELDWYYYHAFGLLEEALIYQGELVPIKAGQRAFELVLGEQIESGESVSSWFDRLGVSASRELPDDWDPQYRELVERRVECINANEFIGKLETPDFKRRWVPIDWDVLEKDALAGWILGALEGLTVWKKSALQSLRELAAAAAQEADFVRAVELYSRQPGGDIYSALVQLIASETVPFLSAHRYTESGRRKREMWEETWALQRRHDSGDQVGAIPIPPKYKAEDFVSKDAWGLRGPMDVPKERFISYPGLEKLPDDSLVIGWAGWDHLQQATALTAFYDWAARSQGWSPDRLIPLLAGLDELIPWLRQWHHEIDPATGTRPWEDFEAFLDDELRQLSLTRADLRAWTPTMTTKPRGRKKR